MLVDEINPSVGALYEADDMYVTETAVKVRIFSHRTSTSIVEPESRW